MFRAPAGLMILLLTLLGASTTLGADAPTVLITGASRGIGLELTRQYADRGWHVIATARKPGEATALKDIASKHPNVTLEALDVTNLAQIDSLAAKYQGKPIDVLLNNAGISGADEGGSFGKLNYEVYDRVHAVNVVGPLKMAEAFLPSVAASDQKKIINITSREGSITWARPGGGYFYRSSKAALNMVMHSLALDLKPKGITVGLVSPGLVKTDFTKGLDFPMMITPEQSATAVIKVIDAYDLAKTGTFIRHTGEESAW